MNQPQGIFVGQPQTVLDALRAGAIARVNGQIISVSESGGSFSKAYAMDPTEVLREVQYAEQSARGTLPPRATRPDLSRRGGFGRIPGSDIY